MKSSGHGCRSEDGELLPSGPVSAGRQHATKLLTLTEVQTIRPSETQIDVLRLEPGDVLFNRKAATELQISRGCLRSGELVECIHQNHVSRADAPTD